MLPRSGGYAQKTTLVGIRVSYDEDPKGIHQLILGANYNRLGNDRLVS